MICPSCKNERWDQEVCPHCGSDWLRAWLAKAELFRSEGRNGAAAEAYAKVLDLDPDNSTVRIERAKCLYLEAVSGRGDGVFEEAVSAIQSVLAKDWEWKRGHEWLVDLYRRFGALPDLASSYRTFAQEDPGKGPMSSEMLKVIELTGKFEASPPEVRPVLLEEETGTLFWKSFWPLFLGLPLLLGLAFQVSSSRHAKEDGSTPAAFFVLLLIVIAIMALVYLCSVLYRKNKKKDPSIE